jgi:hypothetical protein
MCMFCRSLFVLLSFFFWPLCRLFFCDSRILITLWYLQTLLSLQERSTYSDHITETGVSKFGILMYRTELKYIVLTLILLMHNSSSNNSYYRSTNNCYHRGSCNSIDLNNQNSNRNSMYMRSSNNKWQQTLIL